MRKTCPRCGSTFDGATARAVYCSTRCRKNAHYARSKGAPPRLDVVPVLEVPVSGSVSVVESTRVVLADLGALGSPEAAAVLVAAERIDARDDSGAALAALLGRFGAQMAAIRAAYAQPELDVIDELMGRRVGRGA